MDAERYPRPLGIDEANNLAPLRPRTQERLAANARASRPDGFATRHVGQRMILKPLCKL